MKASVLVLALVVCLPSCGANDEHDSVERGRRLFGSTALSPSGLNAYSCATCHLAEARESSLIRAGAPLAGVTLRPWYWGGQENDLLRAINACRREFMIAATPLAAEAADARALWAYLVGLEPGSPEPVPLDVVQTISPLPRGDAARGAELFRAACSLCHGPIHGPAPLPRAPILPEQTVAEHAEFSARVVRLIFIEKVRHGPFFGYGGDMPPFSTQVLDDTQLADVLEALGVLGG